MDKKHHSKMACGPEPGKKVFFYFDFFIIIFFLLLLLVLLLAAVVPLERIFLGSRKLFSDRWIDRRLLCT